MLGRCALFRLQALGFGLALGALSRAFGAGLGLLSERGSVAGRAFSVRAAPSERGAFRHAIRHRRIHRHHSQIRN
jgi:hypothetical protein